jgi:hypothetical protein
MVGQALWYACAGQASSKGISMLRSLILLMVLFLSADARAEDSPLDCSIGPVDKTYGGTSWIVYGCRDGKSVVVVAAAGNPAGPFYFMFFPEADGYKLVGEGTGDKKATQAAYDELSALLSAEFVASLHAEAVRSAPAE